MAATGGRVVALLALLAATAPPAAAQPLSLSLGQAIAIARDTAAVAQVASLREQEAVARVGQARAVLFPGLLGSSEYSDRTFNIREFGIVIPTAPGTPAFPDLIGPVTLFDARIKLTQTLFDPADWTKMSSARHGADVARADLGGNLEQVSEGAALAYLRGARAQAVVGARESDSVLADELVELAEAQVRAGTSPQIEATRARAQLAESHGALLIARDERGRAMIDLARALGLDPTRPIALTDTLSAELGTSSVPEESGAAVAYADAHRPELEMERARLVRARADRSAIKWERLGHIDAEADYGASGLTPSVSIPTYQVGVAWNLPLLDGFRRERRIDEQNSVVRESEVRGRDLADQIAAEIQGALLQLATGREQRQVAAERLGLAAQELQQARARFRGGVAGSLELVNAQTTMVRARDADIDARFSIAAARVAIARAAGVARDLH